MGQTLKRTKKPAKLAEKPAVDLKCQNNYLRIANRVLDELWREEEEKAKDAFFKGFITCGILVLVITVIINFN